jgi:hypothetical protein
VLLAITLVGLFYTVPDTGDAVVLLGVALPVAALGWPWVVARLGAGGSFAIAGLLAWVAAWRALRPRLLFDPVGRLLAARWRVR